MPEPVRISLDAMGGDHGPSVVVPGAALALERHPGTRFLLFGDRAQIEPLLDKHPALKAAAEVRHTDVAVRMDDKPSQALRSGRRTSSMWLAIQAVRDGEADAAVSAGNTGALMAMAKICLKTMAHIERPAIAGMWPTLRGESIVLDIGATIGADAIHLVDLAIMGAAMARIVLGVERPTVGLLNVGTEEIKGVEMVKEAGRILRETDLPQFAYHGFVEGDDIGKGTVDVVVTEGFTGKHRAERPPRGRPSRSASICAPPCRGRGRENRLSPREAGLRRPAGEDGPAPGQRGRLPGPWRHRHQEPRRYRTRSGSQARSISATTWRTTSSCARSGRCSSKPRRSHRRKGSGL
jgi:hypothetical protein